MAYDRLVPLYPFQATYTAKCAGTVSGGDLVEWNSGTDVVGSGASTYAWNDIVVAQCTNAIGNCVGIALATQTSGGEVGIAINGIFSLPAGSGGVSGGLPVYPAGYGNMVIGTCGSGLGVNYRGIGRALTKATEVSGFAIVRLEI